VEKVGGDVVHYLRGREARRKELYALIDAQHIPNLVLYPLRSPLPLHALSIRSFASIR
jgi:hypothetical protein